MRFESEKPSTTIWDAGRDRPLCQFVDNVLETSDPYVIAELEKIGYVGTLAEGEIAQAPAAAPSVGEEVAESTGVDTAEVEARKGKTKAAV